MPRVGIRSGRFVSIWQKWLLDGEERGEGGGWERGGKYD
jgi:hypothetical protein